MKIRILLYLLLLCVACSANAAAPAAATGFNSTFVETRTMPGFSTPLVIHGVMRYDKTHGFHWEITAPYHYVFEMQGDTAHEQLPDGSVRKLDPAQTPWLAAVQHIFVSALAGNRSDLQRYFTLTVTQLTHGQSMLLTPKPGAIAKVITSIAVTESAPGHPERLVIHETSGGRTDIRFTPVVAP